MEDFGYIIVCLLISFVLSLIIGKIFIPIQKKLRYGQNVREDGPKSHQVKNGIPTMGGIIFIIASVVTIILITAFSDLKWSFEISIIATAFLGYALLGYIDDMLNIIRGKNLGLTVIQKLVGQFAIALVLFILWKKAGFDPTVEINTLGINVNLGYFYIFFILIFLVGFSNAVNITDGLDGLATGLSIIAFSVYGLIALRRYIENVDPQMLTVAIFTFAIVGALIGFLVFNIHPAKVFMGDTGSMALGATLAMIAIITRHEITLLIVGGVFVIEILSVVIQIISFKTTKRRVLLMSPLHHHFELLGWTETQIVRVFWILGFIFALLGLLYGVVL